MSPFFRKAALVLSQQLGVADLVPTDPAFAFALEHFLYLSNVVQPFIELSWRQSQDVLFSIAIPMDQHRKAESPG